MISPSFRHHLGKTRPQTGVVFRDPEEAAAMTTQSKIGNVNYELLAPDGSPVFLSFFAPWVSNNNGFNAVWHKFCLLIFIMQL